MMRSFFALIVALLCLPTLPATPAAGESDAATAKADADAFWPQWRGPLGTGVAPAADPPLRWSESENVRWKTPLPGSGLSTPIVWGDRIYLTAAIPYGEELEPRRSGVPGAHDNRAVTRRHEFVVLAVDRGDGEIVWQRSLHRALPHEGGHYSGSLASASPVTDGERVYAFFGSYGLYALDRDGELLWRKDFGRMNTKHAHGEGSSPVLHGDALAITWDHEGESFVVVLDAATGDERWRVARDEPTSWATPIVVEHGGKTQLVVSGTGRVRGYDLASGKVIWACGGLSANVVASPVAGDGMVFAGSSYDTRALLAIRLEGAAGDVTGSDRVAWSRRQGAPYVPSPLLYDGALYFLRHYQGILTRVDAATGEDRPGPIRLDGIREVYASPVAAAGRVYVTDRQGTTVVLRQGDRPEVLAVNRLDDGFGASAALAGRELFLRGQRFLYCLAVADGADDD